MDKVPAKVQQLPAKVKTAAKWSESAYREVYSRYIKPVNAYILRRVRNHHDAEDLTAQVFVQALDHLDPEKAGTDEVASWLFTSARNATANHARRRRYVLSLEEIPDPSDEPADPSQTHLDDETPSRAPAAITHPPSSR